MSNILFMIMSKKYSVQRLGYINRFHQVYLAKKECVTTERKEKERVDRKKKKKRREEEEK